MNEKHTELMRSLVAAQAALWDVIDNPGAKGAEMMLNIIVSRVARLAVDVTGTVHNQN